MATYKTLKELPGLPAGTCFEYDKGRGNDVQIVDIDDADLEYSLEHIILSVGVDSDWFEVCANSSNWIPELGKPFFSVTESLTVDSAIYSRWRTQFSDENVFETMEKARAAARATRILFKHLHKEHVGPYDNGVLAAVIEESRVIITAKEETNEANNR